MTASSSLQGDFAIGTPAAEALGLDDPMIYIKVTPNRPDALGIYGIARDLAAKGLGKLKPLDVQAVPGKFESPINVTLDFPDGDTKPCPLFVGRYFRGVKNGPSPDWLKRRLKAIGLRPISALVDITNYITFAYARPLHVFDADKVKGNIRRGSRATAKRCWRSTARPIASSEGMTVIADDAGPEAVGGIIGGEHAGCSPETRQRVSRSRLFRSAAHRGDRPQARRPFRCALSQSSAASIRPSPRRAPRSPRA